MARYALLSLALAAFAASSALNKRTTSDPGLSNVIADAIVLANDINAMNSVVTQPDCDTCPYTEDQLEYLFAYSIYADENAVNMTESIGNSTTFSEADSAQLGSVLAETLHPAMTTMLSNMVAHSAGFATATSLPALILDQANSYGMSIASAAVDKVSGPTATSEASSHSTALATAFSSAHAALGY